MAAEERDHFLSDFAERFERAHQLAELEERKEYSELVRRIERDY